MFTFPGAIRLAAVIFCGGVSVKRWGGGGTYLWVDCARLHFVQGDERDAFLEPTAFQQVFSDAFVLHDDVVQFSSCRDL